MKSISAILRISVVWVVKVACIMFSFIAIAVFIDSSISPDTWSGLKFGIVWLAALDAACCGCVLYLLK